LSGSDARHGLCDAAEASFRTGQTVSVDGGFTAAGLRVKNV